MAQPDSPSNTPPEESAFQAAWDALPYHAKLSEVMARWPQKWLDPEPLHIFAMFRHSPAVWGKIKARAKDLGLGVIDFERAVTKVRQELDRQHDEQKTASLLAMITATDQTRTPEELLDIVRKELPAEGLGV